MDDGTKKVIGVIAVIILIIFGISKCEDNKKKKLLEEQSRRPQGELQWCPSCKGDKVIYNPYYGTYESCKKCDGLGLIWVEKNRSQIPFTGRLDCTKCSCNGYVPAYAGSTGDCANPKCGHAFTKHRRPGD